MTLPNFPVIGAPKAGTTSLYAYLRQHPDIFMSPVKEPRFFGFPGIGSRRKFPVQSLEEYTALFDGVAGETAIGEATPHYLIYPSAAGAIHAALPLARLVASLRDPVERSYSIYLMNRRDKNVNADRSYLEALETDHNLRETYADRLERFTALFPPERLRIILFEDLVRAPVRTMQELYAFLGVDAAFAPDVSQAANPGGLPRVKLLHDLLANQRLRTAARHLPQGMSDRLRGLRNRNLQKQPLPPDDREAAIAVFRDDILRTQDLIGRDLSAWLNVRRAPASAVTSAATPA
jgi:hypothetical protein